MLALSSEVPKLPVYLDRRLEAARAPGAAFDGRLQDAVWAASAQALSL